MNHTDSFIGIGKNPNPNVPDIPLGFGMELAQNPAAMTAYGHLSDESKTQMIRHIQASATGDDAKSRIRETITKLAGDGCSAG